MPDTIIPVFVFRSGGFSRSPDTVVAVAPMEAVILVYGSGGLAGEGGLSDAFGGAAVYKNDETGTCFFGVWGARNAAKFKSDLESKLNIEVIKETPPARLNNWGKTKARPKPTGLAGKRSRS
ncbi:hypothetical protein [Rhizobium wenxiniae]|uniref:hypothetical protein n=1 Tax=Rhizobium wenxiniae TaxID=1737357 RepID=UPI001C6EF6AC|nr:hypothetical protein [Rhizobium wenxiniae]